jgi:hypothetical protein
MSEAADVEVEVEAPPGSNGLSRYSEPLADAVAQRAARYIRNAGKLPPGERWLRALTTPKSAQRLVSEASAAAQTALALFAKLVHVPCRWDHARRLLVCSGVEHPEAVMLALLGEGLLLLRRNGDSDVAPEPFPRFDGIDQLTGDRQPLVELAPPIAPFVNALPPPFGSLEGTEASGWRLADGWDLPIRLGRIWRIARQSPIKRTQQNELFKRDHDRIVGDAVLGAPPIDAPAPIRDAGKLAFAVVDRLAWLEPYEDGRRPVAPLSVLWPESLESLLEECARALLSLEAWNELGADAPVGAFSSEAPSARLFALLLLDSLPDGLGASPREIAERLLATHPLWTGVADPIGALRQRESRGKLADEWANAFLLGPLFQVRAVEVSAPTPDGGPLVRLSPLGKRLLRAGASEPADPPTLQTLLVQPNHQMIVYRQGLTTKLLAKLMLFADLKTAGPALSFEINADSIYGALECGLSVKEIVALLTTAGGREPPSGVVESIRTWSQKRDRLTVYSNVALYEFNSAADLQEAMTRGMDGTPVTPRMLLVAGQPTFPNLRIGAQRDYLRLPPEPCVTAETDGVTLDVDVSRSDLLLESEIARFADPIEPAEGVRQRFRITRDSLRRAAERGIGSEWLEEWFKRRMGGSLPASVTAMLQLAAGSPTSLRTLVVLEVSDDAVIDGLQQHPRTAGLFLARLGPRALAVSLERVDEVTAALAELGAPPTAIRKSTP